ncbi:MAG: porin, partial [Desulfobulbaceae bacterium]|nr:porin [Desulfobulbaceae bacterium]
LDATSTHFVKRQMDLYLQSIKFGTLSLGHGSTASDGTAEVDLSGTTVAAYSPVGDMAGGQLFYDTLNNTLSDVPIKSVYNNMDGLSRRDRLRYNTPDFSGFSVGGSFASGDAGDLALRYSRKFSGTKFAAAAAWANPGDILPTVDNQYNGSLSALLENGFNVTLAGGFRKMQEDSRDDGNFWYAKLGYRSNLFNTGQSNFSIDYGRSNNLAMNDDEFSSFGIAFVQNIADWGTELYIAYRWHELDRIDREYDTINAVISGARVKF